MGQNTFAKNTDLQSHSNQDWKEAHAIWKNVSQVISKYSARAYRATDLTPTYDAWTTMTLDTESYDPNGNFASNVYTCPVVGKYVVQAGLYFRHNSADQNATVAASIYLGATEKTKIGKINSFFANGDQYWGITGGDVLSCAVGDVIALKYYATGWDATFQGGESKIFMSIHREGLPGAEAAGVGAFLSLTDTPSSYSSANLKYVRINNGMSALEFGARMTISANAPSGGDSGDIWFQYDIDLPTLSKCSVYLYTTMDNLTDITPTLILLDTETDDPGNNFSTVTHLFTCPVAGYYAVTASVAFKDVIASKEYRAHIYINGVPVSSTISQTVLAQNIILPIAGIFKCAENDTIGLWAYVDTGANTVDVYGGHISRTRMEIHLMSLT